MNATRDEERQAHGKPIFSVNDDPNILELVSVVVESAGYTVIASNNTPQTWDQIAALQPSLVLVDLNPVNRSGQELLERLHAEVVTRDIPVIVTSTNPYLLEQVRTQPEEYGAHVRLFKPYSIQRLLGAIRELIGPA